MMLGTDRPPTLLVALFTMLVLAACGGAVSGVGRGAQARPETTGFVSGDKMLVTFHTGTTSKAAVRAVRKCADRTQRRYRPQRTSDGRVTISLELGYFAPSSPERARNLQHCLQAQEGVESALIPM